VDLQEAEPSRNVLRSEIVGDEDPLDHHTDVVQPLFSLVPEVGRKGGRDVDERSEGDPRLGVGSVMMQARMGSAQPAGSQTVKSGKRREEEKEETRRT
jgi:hypothetical protein